MIKYNETIIQYKYKILKIMRYWYNTVLIRDTSQNFLLSYHLFIYSNLFPYIPFRYIPQEWKESHSLYILRHLQSDTSNSRLERVHKNHSYIKTTVNVLTFHKNSTFSRVSFEIYVLLPLIFCVIATISPWRMPVCNRPQKLYFHKHQKNFFQVIRVKEDEMCGVCCMHGVEKKYA